MKKKRDKEQKQEKHDLTCTRCGFLAISKSGLKNLRNIPCRPRLSDVDRHEGWDNRY